MRIQRLRGLVAAAMGHRRSGRHGDRGTGRMRAAAAAKNTFLSIRLLP
jgi:hypothetical protein